MTDNMLSPVEALTTKIDELKLEHDRLKRDMQQRLAVLTDDIATLERTIVILSRQSRVSLQPVPILTESSPAQPPEPRTTTPMSVWASKIRGLKQIDALVLIAREGGGRLKAAQAKRIFLETGYAKGKRANVGSHVYHTLDTSPLFRKVVPGLYELNELVTATDLFNVGDVATDSPSTTHNNNHEPGEFLEAPQSVLA